MFYPFAFVSAVLATLLFFLSSSTNKKCADNFVPTAHMKGGCDQIPHVKKLPFGDELHQCCTLIPDIYKAPLKAKEHQTFSYEQAPISNIFPIALPNAVGTVQLTRGISVIRFGNQELCAQKLLHIADRITARGARVYDVPYAYPHVVAGKSMLALNSGIDLFDPREKTRLHVPGAGKSHSFPLDTSGNIILCINRFVEVSTNPYGFVTHSRKTDSLQLRLIETKTNKEIRELLVPYPDAVASANQNFFLCKDRVIKVFDTSLKEITHPISAAIGSIPNVGLMKIKKLGVHPTLPLALLQTEHVNTFKKASTSLWMLNWSKEAPDSAVLLQEDADFLSFSPDFKWFCFSATVPMPPSLKKEVGFFIVQIRTSKYESSPTIGGPIRLWFPKDLDDDVEMSAFTWVTEPLGSAMILDDKILRWTFPK